MEATEQLQPQLTDQTTEDQQSGRSKGACMEGHTAPNEENVASSATAKATDETNGACVKADVALDERIVASGMATVTSVPSDSSEGKAEENCPTLNENSLGFDGEQQDLETLIQADLEKKTKEGSLNDESAGKESTTAPGEEPLATDSPVEMETNKEILVAGDSPDQSETEVAVKDECQGVKNGMQDSV